MGHLSKILAWVKYMFIFLHEPSNANSPQSMCVGCEQDRNLSIVRVAIMVTCKLKGCGVVITQAYSGTLLPTSTFKMQVWLKNIRLQATANIDNRRLSQLSTLQRCVPCWLDTDFTRCGSHFAGFFSIIVRLSFLF